MYIKKKTDWLTTLLQSEFFGSCSDHQDLRKNEKNVFCIDCSLQFCRHCDAHSQHRWLQICKYVYQDVVRLQEMQKHLDCSKIQVFLCSLVFDFETFILMMIISVQFFCLDCFGGKSQIRMQKLSLNSSNCY